MHSVEFSLGISQISIENVLGIGENNFFLRIGRIRRKSRWLDHILNSISCFDYLNLDRFPTYPLHISAYGHFAIDFSTSTLYLGYWNDGRIFS